MTTASPVTLFGMKELPCFTSENNVTSISLLTGSSQRKGKLNNCSWDFQINSHRKHRLLEWTAWMACVFPKHPVHPSVRFNHLSNTAALDGAAKACTFNAIFPTLGFRLQYSAAGLPVAVVTDIFSVNISPSLFFNYPAFLEHSMSPVAVTEPPPL